MKLIPILTIILMLYMHWYEDPDLTFWAIFSSAVGWMIYSLVLEGSIKLREELLNNYKRDLWHTQVKLKKAEAIALKYIRKNVVDTQTFSE